MTEEPNFETYEEAAAYQLSEWVAGRPWHNYKSPLGTEYESEDRSDRRCGECCPDFSCCRPDLLWSEERRVLFAKSGEKTRHDMLHGSLDKLVGSSAYIISDHNK